MAFHVHLDVLAVHYLHTADARIYDQYDICRFVHLERFEFLVNANHTVVAVFDEKALLHLDLTWTEHYFLI